MNNFTIRQATGSDYREIKKLLSDLPSNFDNKFVCRNAFYNVIEDKNIYCLVLCVDTKIISTITLVVVPNMTHNGRCFSIVENFITLSEFRGKGLSRELLKYSIKKSEELNCYKIMLQVGKGSERESARNIYTKLGFKDNKYGLEYRPALRTTEL